MMIVEAISINKLEYEYEYHLDHFCCPYGVALRF